MKREKTIKHSIAYDGSFEGFLSYIFYKYKHKYNTVSIDPERSYKPNMSSQKIEIISDDNISFRVLKGIIKQSSIREITEIYSLFLTHEKGIELKLFDRISLILSKNRSSSDYYPSKDYLSNATHKILRELQRIDSQIVFHEMRNDISFGMVKPSFNILPLLLSNLVPKHSSKNWILFDEIRKYAIYYLHGNIRFIDQSEPILSDPDFIPLSNKVKFPYFSSSINHSSANIYNPYRNWLDVFDFLQNQ